SNKHPRTWQLALSSFTRTLISLFLKHMESNRILPNPHDPQEELDKEEEDADTLSLCDLPMYHCNPEDTEPEAETRPGSPIKTELFEFCTIDSSPAYKKDIIFCGKIMDSAQPRSKKPFHSKSETFNKLNSSRSNKFMERSRSVSSSSTSSGKVLKVLFGFSRIQPQMELNDLKMRLSRREPAPMFPAIADVERVIAGNKRGGGKGCWGLLRPFAKASFGCVPLM
ncbi:hypothetical protein O6P43_008611, partial [Quillaja saponaria]